MLSLEEDVLEIAQKLEKAVQGRKDESAMGLIIALSELPMTIDVLTKTRIGMKVNDWRKKTEDEKFAKKAKILIKSWKNLVDDKPKINTSINGSSATDGGTPPPSKSPESSQEDGSNSVRSSQSLLEETRTTTVSVQVAPLPKQSNVNLQFDELRSKTVQLLVKALRIGELPDGTLDPDDLATRIEEKLHQHYNGTTDKYKAAVRSRVFNLRDKKNQALRENVLTGAVTTEKFAMMTTEEMASAEMKSLRTKFTTESIRDHQMSVQEGTPSDMFRCGKCGKYNCTYNQMQTRSADEPMTTFVFCRDCGNRWKFC